MVTSVAWHRTAPRDIAQHSRGASCPERHAPDLAPILRRSCSRPAARLCAPAGARYLLLSEDRFHEAYGRFGNQVQTLAAAMVAACYSGRSLALGPRWRSFVGDHFDEALLTDSPFPVELRSLPSAAPCERVANFEPFIARVSRWHHRRERGEPVGGVPDADDDAKPSSNPSSCVRFPPGVGYYMSIFMLRPEYMPRTNATRQTGPRKRAGLRALFVCALRALVPSAPTRRIAQRAAAQRFGRRPHVGFHWRTQEHRRTGGCEAEVQQLYSHAANGTAAALYRQGVAQLSPRAVCSCNLTHAVAASLVARSIADGPLPSCGPAGEPVPLLVATDGGCVSARNIDGGQIAPDAWATQPLPEPGAPRAALAFTVRTVPAQSAERAAAVVNTDTHAVSAINNHFQPISVVRPLLVEMWLLAQSFVLVCSPYSSLALLYDAAWGAYFADPSASPPQQRRTHLCIHPA